MKILNREKRLALLGFDDKWYVIIGIPILGLIIDYILNNSFANYPFGYALVSYSISVFFSTINWLTYRAIIIYFRKRFPRLQQGLLRIAIITGLCLLTVITVNGFGNIFLKWLLGDEYHGLNSLRPLVPIFLITIMMVAIYEAIYFYVKLQKSIREEEQAKQAVVQAQLDALRNQSQPHFLFNSFNTLRDIIDQESKEEAKKFVDKLSNVYRFILESGNENLIALQKEIEFAQAYIYIQKERFGENLIVEWSVDENLNQSLIAPMSLQLLLENAIKHNVVSNAKPLRIQVTANRDVLIVENKIALKTTKLPSTKLGLGNIEKRYRLLSERAVEVKHDNEVFQVTVPLLKMKKEKASHAHINN